MTVKKDSTYLFKYFPYALLAIALIIGVSFLLSPGKQKSKIALKNNEDVSISKAQEGRYKESAKIAYGKIRFGITSKEYKKLMPETFITIGNNNYEFIPVFNNYDKLYMLALKSLPKTANYIDTDLKESLNNLVNIITEKYGKPAAEGEIEFFKFKTGQIQWNSVWLLSTKTIKIGMGELDKGSEYYAECVIYDQPMYDAVTKEDSLKDDKSIVSSSKDF